MEICYVLDASAFINGFEISSKRNFTVPEITEEIKDFESRLKLDAAIDQGLLVIQDVASQYLFCVHDIIYESGDILRLSFPDKKLIALAYMLSQRGEHVKVITDDYTIQNTLKISAQNVFNDYNTLVNAYSTLPETPTWDSVEKSKEKKKKKCC